MKRSHFVLPALCLLLLSQAAFGAEAWERDIARDFDAGGVESVSLKNLAGRVLLEGHSGSGVQVKAVVHSREYEDLGAEEVASLVDVRMERDGDRLVLKSTYPLDEFKHYRYEPEKAGWFSNSNTTVRYEGKKVKVSSGRKSKGLPVWVDYHVRLPEGVGCDLELAVGKVKLDAVAGDSRLDTGSADIDVVAHRGKLLADTGSGDIEVKGMDGELSLDTGSGDLSIRDLQGDLEADTGSGDIDLRDAAGEVLRADTGSGDIDLDKVDYPRLLVDTGSGDVKVVSPASRVEHWEVDTGSGDVTFALDEKRASFRLEVDTGSGEVDCDLKASDIRTRGGDIRSLTVGEGAGRILVDTGSGDISIIKG